MSKYLSSKMNWFWITLAKVIFAEVKGVKDENSGASMLPASAILENCGFNAFSDLKLLDHLFQVGNHWTGSFLA